MNYYYQIWVVPLYLAGVLMDPVEQGRLEVLGVVVSEFSAVSPLGTPDICRKCLISTVGVLSEWHLVKYVRMVPKIFAILPHHYP